MINVAIADDEVLFLKGLKILISDFEEMEVILEAHNGKDLLEKLEEQEKLPDILLLDLNMPEMNGKLMKTKRK